MITFRSGLPAAQAHAGLKESLVELGRAERNAVLWFAEILRRRLYRDLGYSTIHLYAGEALGFSRSKTYQFIRLAESLEKLPALRESVASGEVPWTKARELAKIATPRTEERWIAEAKRSTRRELESKIAAGKARAEAARRSNSNQGSLLDSADSFQDLGDPQASVGRPTALLEQTRMAAEPPLAAEPTPTLNLTAEPTLNLSLRFSALELATFEALIEKIRKISPDKSTRTASREALIREALQVFLDVESRRSSQAMGLKADVARKHGQNPTEQTETRHADSAVDEAALCTRVHRASPYQIIIYQCETCGAARLHTQRGEHSLSPAETERVSCDARILAGKKCRSTIPPGTRRAVLARDGHRCQVKGCGNTRFLEVHHVTPRAQGGGNDPENLITICSVCHGLLHERPLAKSCLAESVAGRAGIAP